MVVREEIRRFLSTTSMKGVPRAATNQSQILQVYWTVGVLALLGFVSYQTYLLVQTYLQYSVVTSFYERPEDPSDMHELKPTLTMCSKNTVPSTADFDKYKLIRPVEFMEYIEKKLTCSTGEDCELIQNLKRQVRTTAGYFYYLGVENATLIAHKVERLIADCRLVIIQGTHTYRVPCTKNTIVERSFVPDFFTCFQISPRNHRLFFGGVVLGVELVLFMDNPAGITFKQDFDIHTVETGMVGMISSNGINSVYAVDLKGFRIPVGTDINLDIHPSRRVRQSPPWGDCVNYTSLRLSGQYECLGACLRDAVNKQCNCTEPKIPITKSSEEVDKPFCLNTKLPREDVIANLLCRQEVMVRVSAQCLSHCRFACREILFEKDLEANPWPQATSYKAFYNHVIKHQPYNSSFEDVRHVVNLNCSVDKSCEMKLSAATRQLRGNFARLTVRVTDQYVFELIDVKKTTLSELMSSLGGALNLWSGITIIVFLELVEVFYHIGCRLLCAPSAKVEESSQKEPHYPEMTQL